MRTGFNPVVLPDLTTRTDGAESRGYAAGYAEGLRLAVEQQRVSETVRDDRVTAALTVERNRVQQAVDALSRATAKLNSFVVPTVENADHTLIETALDLAEAVLGAELVAGRVTTADTLRRTLDAAGREQIVAVRLHPADMATLATTDIPEGLTITADVTLNPGDATADLAHGWYDARIRASLDRARIVLLGATQ